MSRRDVLPGMGLFRFLSTWRTALLLCVVSLTVADTVLLGAATGYLTNGFNSPHIDWLALLALFLPGSLLLDLWLVLCIWLLAIPLLRAASRSPAQLLVGGVIAGAGIPISLAAAKYNVHELLGGAFSLALSRRFSRLGLPELALGAIQEFPYVSLLAVGALSIALAALVLAARLERRYADTVVVPAAPSSRRLLQAVGLLFALNAAAVTLVATTMSDLRFGLERKVSGRLFTLVLDAVTDLDQDGFGVLKRPLDRAPFDASIHPYAIDVPGNGRDENQIAGDHPTGFTWAGLDGGAPPGDGGQRPHLLLIYLESFRLDLLEQRFAGREVTPFLRSLAHEGSSSAHAYTHAPWTLDSRDQLFTGRLVATPGAPTLIDDLAARGYRVAYFSGQDESYGDSAARLGATRGDAFYDARQDIARRTSRSTAPVSLQVSWRTLYERVAGYLSTARDPRPLFLYVNVVDTHFPYWHTEIENLLGVAPLSRAQIRARHAEHVRAAYANTAANVDLAIQKIVEAFRAHVGGARHAILVTSDHGQEIYDHGRLGHGQSLDREQTQVPFILFGIGGDWPEPIAPTDVRRLLVENLARPETQAVPRARFVPDPQRRVFGYIPDAARPSLIALQGLDERIEYDVRRNVFTRVDDTGVRHRLDAPDDPALRELVWRWESLQALR